ncbi:hypothetical protein [Microbacterium aurantiacum]|uniref:hypothetical protein n=1 Tax=Microbacterium aurantiacum TaxID=162393 RepID=UPI0011AFA644|nr:hypothetical protein [Microbacterium aurantiacum]
MFAWTGFPSETMEAAVEDERMATLTIPQARKLLRSRLQLLDAGVTDRQMRASVESGALKRVRRGWYVRTSDWKKLWNEGKHLVEVLAAHLNATPPGPVFWGVSAAVLHGLPLYQTVPNEVHAVIDGCRHSRLRAGIRWHDAHVPERDVTMIDGVRCTSRDRTVLDVTATVSAEAAVAVADAALRVVAVSDGRTMDAAITAEWRGELAGRTKSATTRGIRQTRWVIEFADGRAQLPGESVSRLQLRRLGFMAIELQTRVVGPDSEDYWLDFAFPGSLSFGEFDGLGKYTDPELMGGRTIEEIVLAEKRREDAVRGVTGWRLGRWESAHIATPQLLGRRLGAFGIRPP